MRHGTCLHVPCLFVYMRKSIPVKAYATNPESQKCIFFPLQETLEENGKNGGNDEAI